MRFIGGKLIVVSTSAVQLTSCKTSAIFGTYDIK